MDFNSPIMSEAMKTDFPLCLLMFLALLTCAPGQEGSKPRTAVSDASWFEDRAASAGLRFQHENGKTGAYYYFEMVGAGCALFDFDNDGDLDLYMVQGQHHDVLTGRPDVAGVEPLRDRLFRNDLESGEEGTSKLRFTDITEQSGIRALGYGMGVATGDFDNDGWVDLYITNFGPNQLWRNNGDGSFSDVTEPSGTRDALWSTSAAFVDYDRDGWLDLYVVNYLDYNLGNQSSCYRPNGLLEYCGPENYNGVADRLFHNNGDGSFTDVTVAAGMGEAKGSGLGVVSADFNGDGWLDLYIANDLMPNFLWINKEGQGFRNQALAGGCALNSEGNAEASMGVDAGDIDNDGDEDLFMTHLDNETNTLYQNLGGGFFQDISFPARLGSSSLGYTGFGTAMIDFDNDGWLDIAAVNGAVTAVETLVNQNDPYPYHQKNQLWRNLGNSRFAEVSGEAGEAFSLSEISRGLAVGDVDNDGDADLVVANDHGPVRLLINQIGQNHHWLGIRCLGATAPRDMLGARVGVVREGRPVLWRRVRADASYASANDPRVLVGLGGTTEVERVIVHWPSGKRESWSVHGIDQYITLAEGSGIEIAESGEPDHAPN